MASTITNFSNSINVNYPVPGQDNDSQGFRTNFSSIQSALTIASDEITNLQVNSVNLNDTNDFGNNVVKKASLQAVNQVVYEVSTASIIGINIPIDYNNGNYQRIELTNSGTYSITLQNYPTDSSLCKSVRFEIVRDVGNILINWTGVNEALSSPSNSVRYADPGVCVWDIWTTDNGTNLFANEIMGASTEVTTLRRFTPQQLANWTTQTSATTGTLVYITSSTFDALAYYNGSGWYTLTGTLAVLPVGDINGDTA